MASGPHPQIDTHRIRMIDDAARRASSPEALERIAQQSFAEVSAPDSGISPEEREELNWGDWYSYLFAIWWQARQPEIGPRGPVDDSDIPL